jgi:hypothetical protein
MIFAMRCVVGAENPRHLNVAPLPRGGAICTFDGDRAHDAYGSSSTAQQCLTLCSFFTEPSAVEAAPNEDLQELKKNVLTHLSHPCLRQHGASGQHCTGATRRPRGGGNGTSKIPFNPSPRYSHAFYLS